MHSFRILSVLFILVLLSGACEKQEREFPSEQTELAGAKNPAIETTKISELTEPLVEIDLPQIKQRGKVIALTAYNANSYFIYKGEPLGFEYELLKLLADHLGIELEIVIVNNLDQIFNKLNEGVGDIIAYNLTITKKRLNKVTFSDHHSVIRQVLVQKLPDNWYDMKRHEIDKTLVTNPIDLIGKKIYVRKGSSYYSRLINLSDEIGGDIDILEVPGDVSTEELIRKVSEGEIEYTVCDENLAMINQIYYSNIDISTAISFPQRIAWAVRKNSPRLEMTINQWLRRLKREPTFNVIYNRYYQDKRYYQQRIKSEYLSTVSGKISPYDDYIKNGAQKLEWDWRLIASQIYQESQFDPKAKSWVGAAGLMQLMPRIGKEFGAKNVYNPAQNIAAGINYLEWLKEYWEEIPDSLERMKFILASYNAGQGHVQDARRLAEKFDKDPDKWDKNVAEFMLKKSQEKYYTDEVVDFGYCRGDEPVNYVKDILDRYDHYQRFIQP
jgi:membrane-bound lytic murein transglycosylase F